MRKEAQQTTSNLTSVPYMDLHHLWELGKEGSHNDSHNDNEVTQILNDIV